MVTHISRARLTGVAAALLCAAALPACADPDHPVARDNMTMLPDQQRQSEIPWNPPPAGGGNPALGGLGRDPRIGGQSN